MTHQPQALPTLHLKKKDHGMKVTIEVTKEELNWIKKRFTIQSALFGGEPIRPSSSIADKILMRVLMAPVEQENKNK